VPKFVADSSTATGLAYAAPVAGGANWTLLNSGGTTLTGAQTITVSGISGKDKIKILVQAASSASVSSFIGIQLNADTASNYYSYGAFIRQDSTYTITAMGQEQGVVPAITIGAMSANATSAVTGSVELSGCNSSGVKVFSAAGAGDSIGGNAGQHTFVSGGYYNSASTISSISVKSGTGNFDSGTVFVYTSA